jgi:hypothetical protein
MYVRCTENGCCDTSIFNQNVPIKLKFLPNRLQRKTTMTDLNFDFAVLFLCKTDDELEGWF